MKEKKKPKTLQFTFECVTLDLFSCALQALCTFITSELSKDSHTHTCKKVLVSARQDESNIKVKWGYRFRMSTASAYHRSSMFGVTQVMENAEDEFTQCLDAVRCRVIDDVRGLCV